MSQELIFTTLPNQRINLDGKDFLKLSVFCSVRLTSAQKHNFGSISGYFKLARINSFSRL
jgi:hypothetical protein